MLNVKSGKLRVRPKLLPKEMPNDWFDPPKRSLIVKLSSRDDLPDLSLVSLGPRPKALISESLKSFPIADMMASGKS